MPGEDTDGDIADVRVLVVDDEKEVADAYALRLRNVCDVRAAYGGREALETVEEETIDVILLDRRMPEMSGDEVLEELDERGFDGRVIMLTAIDPGFDVLDLPFDDYLRKPVEREGLAATIDHHRTVLAYELLGEYFSVESKRAVLAAELSTEERQSSDRYGEIEATVEALESRVRRLLSDPIEMFESFDEIGREGL
ncbi:response regulator [Halobaculum sp. MBLA0147]|uniref:response regulator n=1 Tax=Halobaculum sp. MBLA0147 TaxID=3079934 RepID=UPI0035236BA4